ncbi:MAG TPA: CHASE domain-containing protein, partial [Candidatus Brocadiia bacterium]|nr:CHASE domain-containing protein [Candidatus Brocadiia bacterium]
TEPLAAEPAVHNWGWAPIVPAAEKEAFERAVRADGAPDFQIWERDAAGRRIPARPRAVYHPVTYLAQSFRGSMPVNGFDLGSEPTRLAAIQESLKADLPVATDPVILADDGPPLKGMLVLQRVLSSTRSGQVAGHVFAVVRFDSLLRGVLDPQLIHIKLAMLRAGASPEILASALPAGRAAGSSLSRSRPLCAFGRVYWLTARPGPAFEEQNPARAAALAALTGLLLTISLSLLVTAPARRRDALEKLIAQRDNELRRNEAFTRAVMDNLPIGVAVNSVDPAVTFTYMNDNFPKFYHSTREAISSPDGFWNAVYEDPVFREQIRARVIEDCASGDPERMKWDDVPITRNGQVVAYVSARNTPVPGKPLMISTVWDVTERKRAELALRESEERFRALFDEHAAVKLLIDPSTGAIVDANRAAAEYYGWSREQLITMRIQDINTLSSDEVKQEMEKARTLKRCYFEFRHRRADGSIREVAVFSSRVPYHGKELLHSIIHDISSRREAEEEREKLRGQLLQSQKMESIGRLAGGVAHDFNNLLMGILGYADLCRDGLEPGHPIRPYLDEITNAARRSTDLTRQLLAFARRQTIAPAVLDLN